MSLPEKPFGHGWSLFLDRDGVLNKRLPGDYVKRLDELQLLPGVPEALAIASRLFDRIFVVTNQQGIGKGLMTEADLKVVHHEMQRQIEAAGGRIDRFYHAPLLASDAKSQGMNAMRKPGIGMALQAKADFPEVDFSKSLLVGDSLSDLRFGRNAGMFTVFVLAPVHGGLTEPHLADETCWFLTEFIAELAAAAQD